MAKDYRIEAWKTATTEERIAADIETQECGYVTTPGYRYCRDCLGYGSLDRDSKYADPCPFCGGQGETEAQ